MLCACTMYMYLCICMYVFDLSSTPGDTNVHDAYIGNRLELFMWDRYKFYAIT